jgi:RHS repeat-associated protein
MESLTNSPGASKLRLNFNYDTQSHRTMKKVESWTGSAWSLTTSNQFLYDSWNLIATLNQSLSTINSFVWGLDLSGSQQGAGGIGGLLILRDATQGRHLPVFDGNGNLAGLTDASSGTNSATYEYGPFGETLRVSGPLASLNPFRFSNKFQDDETLLLYYGYRSYNPTAGSWLNRDPVQESGGQNLYAFTANDAANSYDHLGLEWKIFNVSSAPRADVTGGCGDTVRQLAEKIHLDADEYRRWIVPLLGELPGTPDDPLVGDVVFSIPNTVYVNRVGSFPVYMAYVADQERLALKIQGFKVIYQTDLDNAKVLAQFADTNIFGFINVAHGEEEPYGHGEIETTDTRGLGLESVKGVLHHKLGGMMIIQCWGDEVDWPKILAKGAYYWAGHGKIRFWDVPRARFNDRPPL